MATRRIIMLTFYIVYVLIYLFAVSSAAFLPYFEFIEPKSIWSQSTKLTKCNVKGMLQPNGYGDFVEVHLVRT